ncbi:MAG: molybdopterin-dependent oxidoreductase, partial [Actinobacteria bacterium]|nr:molybdopterin-dependent oxidoreductase [Actinomycetota bacterium]
MGALSANIDVKDGKIVRTRPMQIDEKYSAEYLRPWSIKARGGSFDSTFKTDIPPFAYVYKKRAYSKNRVPYPMKRVDWDPNGERHPENRGKSKFERISWDEATDIIASEIKRVQATYGPMAILAQGDGHGETKVIHATHSCQMGLLALTGGFTMQARNPDSWEGWYWGAKHVWGCDNLGQGDIGNLMLDIAENTDIFLHWGCDEETTPWGWEGQISSKYCFWLTEIGVEQVHISPDLNYSGAIRADRWIPVYPNTDAALQCAIAYIWMTNGWYDKEYVESHVIGFDWEEYYILGREDGVPKTPEWASPICGVPVRIIKALAKRWYEERVSIGHCNGGSYIRSAYSAEPGRLEVVLMGMQGLGKPGRNVMKFIEWGLFGMASQCPNPKSEVYPSPAAAYQGFDWNNPSIYDIRWRHIPKTLIPDAILGQHTLDNPLIWHGVGLAGWPRVDQFNEYQYPNKKTG